MVFYIPGYRHVFRLKWAIDCEDSHRAIRVLKSATKNRDPKNHLSLSDAICDRKHANRIPQPKVVV